MMVESIKELRKICYESRDGEIDWWAKNVSTMISIYVTKLLLYTSITANQVTWSMIIVGLIASILFSFGNYWFSLMGGLLLHFAIILDGTDGEIARYRKMTSTVGQYLDRLYHDLIPPLIFVSISWGVYHNFPNNVVLLLGSLASVFIILLRLIDLEKFKLLSQSESQKEGYEEWQRRNHNFGFPSSVIAGFVTYCIKNNISLMPANTKVFVNAIFIGALLNYLHLILILYGIAMPCQWIWRNYSNLRALQKSDSILHAG